MNTLRGPLRFRFQTKVLVPVLAVLVALSTITLWNVLSALSQQVQNEARQTVTTAEAIFLNTLRIRTRNVESRYRNLVNEPRFKATAQTGDAKTLGNYLRDLLDELREENEFIVFTSQQGKRLAFAQRNDAISADAFEKASAPIIHLALDGELATAIVSGEGKTYDIAAVPVLLSEGGPQIGVLTIASRINETAMQEFKSLTQADIFLLSGNAVTASTLRHDDLPEMSTLPAGGSGSSTNIHDVLVHNEHYLALVGVYHRNGQQTGLRYVLLSSYEQKLRELEHTRLTLLTMSVAGIVISTFVVWYLIGRVTAPLIELRDNAEAVGRGDFSRRITRFSNDECGALAVSFNRMTDNLQASRADLEKAVGTLKTTQAQLVQSEKLSAVGQFVAGVAHELNNPLTSVIGFSDLLTHMPLEPQYRTYVGHIAKNADRCHKIVNSLLGFSRQHEPERKPIRLNELADAVIEIIAYDLRTSNIAFKKEYQAELPYTQGDSHQLQQVILNVISNARQALENFRRDGEIVLRTGSTGDRVWLRIKDNGPGISAENLSRIFDPFFTTKPQGKGTGLGLSLSYGIMQEHRGSIRAESQPGAGTEFILELPIFNPEPISALTRIASAAPFQINTTPFQVLVIDDEESILQLVSEVLRSDGHQVQTVSSGQAALEMIFRESYDIIISDWKMPGLNGINLYQELLAKKPHAAARVLFMTGDVIKESFQEFLKKNQRTCLPKPFSLREFHAAIAGIVKK